MKKITCLDMELALVRFFGYRQNIIVPNVSWGLQLGHECDLFILKKSGYAYEIEIKISKSDLKADLKKMHQHRSNKIKYLYFAIPEYLIAVIDLIPLKAGVIVVKEVPDGRLFCKIIRPPKINKSARKLTENESRKLIELGTMRIWSLKAKIKTLIDDRRMTDG